MNEDLLKKLNKMVNVTKTASLDDLQELTIFFVSIVKEMKVQLDKSVTDNKGEVDDNLNSIFNSLKETENNLQNIINETRKSSATDIKTLAKQLRDEIYNVELQIPLMPEMPDIVSLEERLVNKIKAIKILTLKEVEDELPKLGIPIRDGLQKLKKDERLDSSAIRGLDKEFGALSDSIVTRAIGIVDQRTSFLIQKVSNLKSEVDALQANPGLNIGDTIGSATVGSVFFAGPSGALAQDNPNFFWDDTNNRLGVGTASPTSKLTIAGDGTTPALSDTPGSQLVIQGTTNAKKKLAIGVNTDDATMYSYIQSMEVDSSTRDLVLNQRGGNVGIGTATPGAKLDVRTARTSGVNATALLLSDPVTGVQTSGFGNTIQWQSNSGSSIAEIMMGVGGDGTNNQSEIRLRTQNSFGGIADRLTVSSAGNVGIGITNPAYKLDVGGSMGLNGGQLVETNAVYSKTSSNLSFGTGNFGTIMTAANSGYVGIGTTTPISRLDIRDTTAVTSAATNILTYNHRTSGTAAAGFGIGLTYQLQSSTTYDTSVAQTIVEWVDAAHATRRGQMVDYLLNTAGTPRPGIAQVLQSGGTTVRVGIGTTTPLSLFNVIGTDASNVLFCGATKATRFSQNSTDSRIEGVDNTGYGSFEGLAFKGSYLAFETTNEAIRIISNGGVGIGLTAPTAFLHLKAGTASVDTAPLKFTSGTINTTAVAAQYEYNGNHRITNVALLRMPLGGTLFDYFTDTTVGGAEADIYTSTLLANTFNANGDKIIASYGGNFVTIGTELTQLKAYFAGTAIWDSTGITMASGTSSWRIFIELIRVSSTVVRYTVSLNTSGASGYVYATSGEVTGLTLSATNIIKITGISSGVGSGVGDIIGKSGYIEFKPAA